MTAMTAMTAWHNNPALKAEVVARLRAHRAEDSIIQGLYQESDLSVPSGWRGCALGCTLPPQWTDGSDPMWGWWTEVEQRYGIPEQVARIIDAVFEGLPPAEAGDFAVAAMVAIPVGADLSMAVPRLLLDSAAAAAAAADDDAAAYAAADWLGCAARKAWRWMAERLIHHLTHTHTEPLWAVMIPASDDLWAMPDRPAAERVAWRINDDADQAAGVHRASAHTPQITAQVVPWPWSAQAHARSALEHAPLWTTEETS